MQAVAELQETPLSEGVLPSGLGEDWADHSLPFQAWIRVLPSLAPMAMQEVEEVQERSLEDCRPLLDSVHSLPSQRTA